MLTEGREELRQQLVSAAIVLLRRHAFNEISLADVTDSIGVPIEKAVDVFPTFNDLLVEVIDVWNGQRMAPLLPVAHQYGAVAFLRAIVRANVSDPALMRVLTASANLAATPDHVLAPILRAKWVQFHALVQRALADDIAVGREPETMEPARGAEQLIAMYEGLQLQSMLRPHMDVIESYDRAVTRLRDGWSNVYAPPVWEI